MKYAKQIETSSLINNVDGIRGITCFDYRQVLTSRGRESIANCINIMYIDIDRSCTMICEIIICSFTDFIFLDIIFRTIYRLRKA